MFLLLLLFLFSTRLLTPQPAHAQVPLFYQLNNAYHSDSFGIGFFALPTSAPTPSVLGATTTSNQNGSTNPVSGTFTIAVLGDSMIDTLTPSLPQLRSALKSYYPQADFKLLNYGFGGSNLEYAIYRLSHEYNYLGRQIPSLISQKPDIIVLESFAYNNYGNSQPGLDKQWQELSTIIADIKKALPNTKIVLAATIAPNSTIFGNGIKDVSFSADQKLEKSTTIRRYLDNLIHFAQSQNYPLADAYHPSLLNDNGNPLYINAGDSLHPSGPGGVLFCNIVTKTIFDSQLIN
jgi:hypothetical protein